MDEKVKNLDVYQKEEFKNGYNQMISNKISIWGKQPHDYSPDYQHGSLLLGKRCMIQNDKSGTPNGVYVRIFNDEIEYAWYKQNKRHGQRVELKADGKIIITNYKNGEEI